jgi:hypothetical protein
MPNEITAAIAGGLFAVAGAIVGYLIQRSNENEARKAAAMLTARNELNADLATFAAAVTTAIHKIEWLTWMAKNYGDEAHMRQEIKRYQESMYGLWANIDSALLTVAARSIKMHARIEPYEKRLRYLDEQVARAAKPLVVASIDDDVPIAISRLGGLLEPAHEFWTQFREAMKETIRPPE